MTSFSYWDVSTSAAAETTYVTLEGVDVRRLMPLLMTDDDPSPETIIALVDGDMRSDARLADLIRSLTVMSVDINIEGCALRPDLRGGGRGGWMWETPIGCVITLTMAADQGLN